MIMGSIYRPGPRKNLVFGLYGAFAPLGFFFGIIVGGVTGEFLSWRWYFWLGSIVVFAAGLGAVFSFPRGKSQTSAGDMDLWGAVTIVPALILIVFAITGGAHATLGWKTNYIIITFVVGGMLLIISIFLEGWVTADPLLPRTLFKPKHMKTLMMSLIFGYGTFGIFVFYASF